MEMNKSAIGLIVIFLVCDLAIVFGFIYLMNQRSSECPDRPKFGKIVIEKVSITRDSMFLNDSGNPISVVVLNVGEIKVTVYKVYVGIEFSREVSREASYNMSNKIIDVGTTGTLYVYSPFGEWLEGTQYRISVVCIDGATNTRAWKCEG